MCPFLSWGTFGLFLLSRKNYALFMYKSLCAHVLFFFHIFPGVELLDHVETLTEPSEELPDYLPKLLHHLNSSQPCSRVSVSPHSYQRLLLSALFDYGHPSRYEVLSHWFLISLTANDVFFFLQPFKNVKSFLANGSYCRLDLTHS